ncbi:MAG: hypothetical protein ACLFQU_09760 [Candidatus Kapaibacterium sp.]
MKFIISAAIIYMTLAGCYPPGYVDRYSSEPPDRAKIPKSVKFIAQSGTSHSLFQTVIDIDSREIVILEYYNGELRRVYRPGMKINPEDYGFNDILSTDAPDTPELDEHDKMAKELRELKEAEEAAGAKEKQKKKGDEDGQKKENKKKDN